MGLLCWVGRAGLRLWRARGTNVCEVFCLMLMGSFCYSGGGVSVCKFLLGGMLYSRSVDTWHYSLPKMILGCQNAMPL